MINKYILDNINNILFIDNNKTILVTVSGGIDSMVMLDILIKSKCRLSVAHVNFNLRNIESDKDEIFVKNFCIKKNIPFFSKKFNTKDFAIKNKLSIQMAARKLRYEWFNYISNSENYNFIAVGHHLDDSIETFFINLIRGTGIKGLLGIVQNNKIIRPLLKIPKYDIIKYAKINKLEWRNDFSNNNNIYLRNHIRNIILPKIIKSFPLFHKSIKKTLNNLYEENCILEKKYKDSIKYITIFKSENPIFWKIDYNKLKKLYPIKTFLYKIFSPYGFVNIKDLIQILNAQCGKNIFSNTNRYRIIKNRDHLLLIQKKSFNKKKYKINNLGLINEPFLIKITESSLKDNKSNLSIDSEKIQFPLYLRHWKHGDFIYNESFNIIKVSKLFKQNKYSLLEKENIWLLINNDKLIISVIGLIINNNFIINKNTKKILNIYMYENCK